jgi:Skp family chaperone for outer membrane proteins
MIFHIVLALSLQLPAGADSAAAFVNVPRLIAESALGKAVTAQLRTVQTQKQKAIADKQAEVQQLNRSSALPARIQRAQLELERLAQDSEAELAALDRQLQDEFDKKLRPVVAELAEEEHIGIIFEYPQQLVVWVSPSIDVTSRVIARLDAAEARKQK